MKWSESFFPTLKEKPSIAESQTHILSLRAGLLKMLSSGIYSYLPLGFKVLKKIENIVREEMVNIGAQEVLLPALQPLDLWIKTKRDVELGPTMIRFIDRRNRPLVLGPTHEEVITDLVKDFINSYKQLPLILFQIQTKFRDEPRPRFGLVRSCEFIMKDAYSFDKDEKGLDESYEKFKQAYFKIFKRCGLDPFMLKADPGVMGGKESAEFLIESEDGEDKVLKCQSCQIFKKISEDRICENCSKEMIEVNALEIGHIFKLGVKYSEVLGAYFLDEKGERNPIIMGCYGIGVSRLISAVIAQNKDEDGIIWPKEVSPFDIEIICLDTSNPVLNEVSLSLYKKLKEKNLDVLLDDRPLSAGVKLKDALLIGVPILLIIGRTYLEEKKIEIEIRRTRKKIKVCVDESLDKILKIRKDILK